MFLQPYHGLIVAFFSLAITPHTKTASAMNVHATIGCAAESADILPADKGASCGSVNGDFANMQVEWPAISSDFTFTMNNDQNNGYPIAKALQGSSGTKVKCPKRCGVTSVTTKGTTCYIWSRTDAHKDAQGVEHTAKVAILGSVVNPGGDEARIVLCSGTCTGYSTLWC